MVPFAPNFWAIAINSSSTFLPKLSWMIKATSSISWFKTPAISSTKRWTIGLPATGIKGFGTVYVWGRRREPRPAIGTIIFIRKYVVYCNLYIGYFTPVLPKPPSPLAVSDNSATSNHSALSCFAMFNWAIRSPFSITKSSFDKFTKITPISPR